MTTIRDVFVQFGPEYIRRFGDAIPGNRQKVIETVMECRTPACGMAVYECSGCGDIHYIPRSCGNLHCPSCQHRKGLDWMNIQADRHVPTHHFMITFTVLEEVRPFIRSRQRIAYNALFKASSETMRNLVRDEKFIGGDVPGFFG